MLFAVIYAARDVTEEKDKRSLNLFTDPSGGLRVQSALRTRRRHRWHRHRGGEFVCGSFGGARAVGTLLRFPDSSSRGD